MLCQFTFENFKSFKDPAFLDFCAEPISDNGESVLVDQDGERFLPVVSIYGPNGGGKSTVLEALGFLKETVVKPVIAARMNEDLSADEAGILRRSIRETSQEKFHKFDPSCRQRPISFEILFRTGGYEYQYELSILKNEITRENLYYKEIGKETVTLVFERGEEDCTVGPALGDISVERLRSSLPLLSHIASAYDISIVNLAMKWFFQISFIDYDQPLKDQQILLPKQPEKRKRFFEMLREMDIPIIDLRVEEDTEGKVKGVFTKHLVNGKEIELTIQEESSGTRKIFSCLARISDCLEEGKVLVADELDAKLHPKLLEFIIALFTDPEKNKKGAQLLITSHDIVNMNPAVLRRDEIWFCALGHNHASSLYSLISFKEENGKPPRKDAIYGKRYLEGKYGADPYIRRGLHWGAEA